MKHDFYSHFTLLAHASTLWDVNDIVNSTTVFTGSRQLKQCSSYNFRLHDASHTGISTTIPTVSSMAPLHLLGHVNQKGMTHDFSGYLMPLVPTSLSYDGKGIINGTTAFAESR